MSQQFPVTVAVRRPDGQIEQVRVGTATRTAEGFSLQLGELTIGAQPAAAEPPRPRPTAAGGELTFPNYGRSKGAPIQGASRNDLEFYANGARRSLADPSKARFHDKERALLAAIEAELARQGGGDAPGGPPDEDVPMPTDDDAQY